MLALRTAVLMVLAGTTVVAQDPLAEIDNDWVRVLRVKRGPHEKAPMSQHPATVMVYLTNYHQRITGAAGKAQEASHNAGDISYTDAAKQAEVNLSDQPLEAVEIELKPRPAGFKPARIALDPVQLDPQHHLVPFENDRVRVLRTILEPHLKSPMHEHPHYVVVYLTELHTTMKLGDGRIVDNPRRAGEIAWREALKHETENIGDRTAVEIQVELK